MDGKVVVGVTIPFKHLEACPKYGRQLSITSTKEYDVEGGVERLVTYQCEAGD